MKKETKKSKKSAKSKAKNSSLKKILATIGLSILSLGATTAGGYA